MTKEMGNEKISIIVPVWNVEPFLRRCVKSLLDQTYKNLEIILIDDESPDNCGKICDDFAKEDNRVKVIHQKNAGVCTARNAGLNIATGEYIGFVDPDDWATPDMFEYLLENAKKYDAEITCCRYFRVIPKETTISETDGKLYIYDKNEAIKELVNKVTIRAVFWNKLFKKELFDNLRFPEGMIYEGTYLVHKLFELSEKIVFLPDPKYYYYKFDKSYVNTKTVKNQVDFVYAQIARYNDLHEKYPQLKSKLMEYIVRQSSMLVKLCGERKDEIESQQDRLEIIGEFIKDNYSYITRMNITNKIVMEKLQYLISLSNNQLRVAKYLGIGGNKYKELRNNERNFKNKLFKKEKNKPLGLNMKDFTQQDQRIFDRLHQTELELMNEFVRICDKHNLKYYLYGGTLLGAVRHQGFIPWDDDIDIVMMRDDYEKFGEICKKELNEKYFYQTCMTDPDFPMLFAKLRMNNSYVREKKWDHLSLHKGIYIDILPLDNFPSDKKTGDRILKKFAWLNMICNQEKIDPTWYPHKYLLFKFYQMIPKKFKYERRKRLLKKANSYKGENVCSFGSHYRPFRKRVLKKAWFQDDEYMTFEGRQYRVPKGAKEYLIHLFGEFYMELPPVEDRENHFNFYEIEFDTNNKRGK